MSTPFLLFVTGLIIFVALLVCFSIIIKPMQSLLSKIFLGMGIFALGLGGYGLFHIFTKFLL